MMWFVSNQVIKCQERWKGTLLPARVPRKAAAKAYGVWTPVGPVGDHAGIPEASGGVCITDKRLFLLSAF